MDREDIPSPDARELRIEVIDDETASRMRTMTPQQRAVVSNTMYIQARAAVLHQIRRRHPNWTEAQVIAEAARRRGYGAV